MLETPEIVLEQFRVSPQNGFLPAVAPLRRLEDPYYEPWESIVCDLPTYIKDGNIRQKVDCLPVLSTSMLKDEPELRRAYVVLAYLTHAYVWGGEKPSEVRSTYPSTCGQFLIIGRDYHQPSRVPFSTSPLT